MEQFILKKLDMELNGEDYLEFVKAIMLRAKITKRVGDTVYFSYQLDTNAENKIEFIAEGELKNSEVFLKEFFIHHTANDIWNITLEKVKNKIYVIKKGDFETLVTLVNEKELKEGLQNVEVAAFGHSLNIFKTEEDYLEDVKKCGAVKIENGAILPLVYLNRKLDKQDVEELDRLVTLRGQIIKLKEESINVFGIDAGRYIIATVRTCFGDLPVYFKLNSIETKNLESIKEGDILVGNVSITCKVKGE